MTIPVLLHELQDAHLIRPSNDQEPIYLFRHVLMQEAAYQSLLVKDRRDLHRQVAVAFEQVYASTLDEHIPTLAYHYGCAEEWTKSAEYARRAGERAYGVYALREAIGYYAQALDALERLPEKRPAETCDSLLGWSQAAFGFEPFPSLIEKLERAEQLARQLGDKRRLAKVLNELGNVQIASGRPTRAGPPLAECLDLATEMGDERLLLTPSLYMGMSIHTSEPHQAIEWFNRTIKLARKYGDIDSLAYALGAKAMVQARVGQEESSRRDVKEALQLAPSVQSPMANSDVYLFVGWSYLELGENSRAVEYAKMGVEKALSADNMECACFAFACLGLGYLRVKKTGEAIHALEEAVRRSKKSGAEEAGLIGQMGLGIAQFSSGHSEATADIQKALAHAKEIGGDFVGAMLAETLGEMYLKDGEIEDSIKFLTDALDFYRRQQMRPYLSRALELLATALERKGERAKADQAREERAELGRELTLPVELKA